LPSTCEAKTPVSVIDWGVSSLRLKKNLEETVYVMTAERSSYPGYRHVARDRHSGVIPKNC